MRFPRCEFLYHLIIPNLDVRLAALNFQGGRALGTARPNYYSSSIRKMSNTNSIALSSTFDGFKVSKSPLACLMPPGFLNCATRPFRGRSGLVLTASLRMSSTVALPEYVEHYHNERNHQGVGNRLLAQPERSTTAARRAVGRVQRRERLGGLLSFYHRNAA
jgi:hypothetical protein